jgi:hypothetical protein
MEIRYLIISHAVTSHYHTYCLKGENSLSEANVFKISFSQA